MAVVPSPSQPVAEMNKRKRQVLGCMRGGGGGGSPRLEHGGDVGLEVTQALVLVGLAGGLRERGACMRALLLRLVPQQPHLRLDVLHAPELCMRECHVCTQLAMKQHEVAGSATRRLNAWQCSCIVQQASWGKLHCRVNLVLSSCSTAGCGCRAHSHKS